MKKIIQSLVVMVLVGGMVGCASVPMGDLKKDQSLKQFQVKPGKSQIYIYRNEGFGASIRMDVSVDGLKIGQTAAKTYLYTELSPGTHSITSSSENDDTVTLNTQAGKIYFIWQEVKMGFLFARTKLHLVSKEEGKKGVLKTKLAQSN